MLSLVFKELDTSYPDSAGVAAQIDALLEDAKKQGREVDAIKLPYGYLSRLKDARMTSAVDSFETYKGIRLLVV